MDKTLEIVLVATTLVVAAVVVISMLQGQSDSFGEYSDQQTESSQCGIGYQQYKNSIDCSGASPSETDRTDDITTRYSGCGWTSSASASDGC